MPDSDPSKSLSIDVDYNVSVRYSLQSFIDGRFNRVLVYGVSEQVKALIGEEFGINYDHEITYGFASSIAEVRGGVSKGGINREFIKTSKYGVWFELQFDNVAQHKQRLPSMVALVRTTDGNPPTYQSQ